MPNFESSSRSSSTECSRAIGHEPVALARRSADRPRTRFRRAVPARRSTTRCTADSSVGVPRKLRGSRFVVAPARSSSAYRDEPLIERRCRRNRRRPADRARSAPAAPDSRGVPCTSIAPTRARAPGSDGEHHRRVRWIRARADAHGDLGLRIPAIAIQRLQGRHSLGRARKGRRRAVALDDDPAQIAFGDRRAIPRKRCGGTAVAGTRL